MSKNKKPRKNPWELGLPPGGIDTHAHLDLEGFYEQGLDAVFDAAKRSGVSRIGQVFLGPDAYHDNKHLFADRPEVFFLLGIYPNRCADYHPDQLDQVAAAFEADPRLKALGEIGMDFYHDKTPRDIQERAFRDQLALARDMDLSVAIHSRDCHDLMVSILEESGFKGRPLLWHCFGEGPDLARRLVDNGWHLSIPGTVTYKRCEPLREAVKIIPAERMVFETDCPFLTPDPWRGKENHPGLVAFTAKCVADLRGEDPTQVWLAAGNTAKKFFKLADKP